MSRKPDEAMIDEFDLPHLSSWMSRALTALKADLRSVDCGSLDVLLYCPEDVSDSAPRDRRLTEPAR